MAMELPTTGDPIALVADLYRQGVRRIGPSRPVYLTGRHGQRTIVWTMILLRDLATIDALLGGAPVAELPAEIIGAFVEVGLAGQAGDLARWLPHRVRRWPWPSMIV